MYSSVFGGITTNVACMVLPLDDHMVHRGHSVFDTAILLNGYSSILQTFSFNFELPDQRNPYILNVLAAMEVH